MRNLAIPLCVWVVTSFAPVGVVGQQGTSACPTVRISGPQSAELNTVKFSASISRSSSNNPLTYRWSVSAGRIVSGQGTPAIEVDVRGLFDYCMNVAVEIDGLPSGCTGAASYVAKVSSCCADPRMFDMYGAIPFRDEMMRLENLAAQLRSEPGAEVRIVPVDGRRDRKGLAFHRAVRARAYLINRLKIDWNRVIIDTLLMSIHSPQPERTALEFWMLPQAHETPCN